MSRAIQFQRFGGAEILDIIDRDVVVPDEGEVLVAPEAIGINWFDVLWRRDMAPTKVQLPAGLGSEMAGVVIDTGPGVEGFAPGDRVASIPAFDPNCYASYAEQTVMPVESLIHYSTCLTPAEASVHYVPSLLSWLAFREVASIQPGDTVLITGACYVSGPYAVQVARALGARVIAATPFETGIDYLHALGAEAVIHTESQDLAKCVSKLTEGRGVDLVLDALGGRQMSLLGDVVAPGGDLVLYGLLGGNETSFPATAAFNKNIHFHVHCLSNFSGRPEIGIAQNRPVLARAVAAINAMTERGELVPQIDHRFRFEEVAEAHRYLESCANHHGRIVLDLAHAAA
ncbi:zinc-dependent alcohol dehydrogenase family protein [Salinicola aestuarinus]|uniref:zinc-dependent alcohol dehydrogenase family protein n=1 Tax=Salinicola aestuarinus TaxID=1949082 RepID=UPI000DA1FFA8|nr:zinc-dependent alcohol dehydrogenase family protein [Salinicola aestuarinus]